MKRWGSLWKALGRGWGGALVLLLSACTGTQEPPLPALLALGEGSGVRFVKALPLQAGRREEVGFWDAPGLLDLAYAPGLGRLFLLFPDRVAAYDTRGFTEAAAPQALLEERTILGGCAGGYLRLGENQLLVACPGLSAYTWPLEGGEVSPVDLTGLDPGARLALGPEDRLAYAQAGLLGHRNLDGSDPKEKPAPTDLPPQDLVYDRDTGRLWALYGGAFQSRLLRLDRDLGLSSRDFGYAYTRLALNRNSFLVALGGGFQAMNAQGEPLGEAQSPYTPYQKGLAAPDGYLYLAQGSALEVWDLLARPPQRVARVLLPSSPQALAFIPVE